MNVRVIVVVVVVVIISATITFQPSNTFITNDRSIHPWMIDKSDESRRVCLLHRGAVAPPLPGRSVELSDAVTGQYVDGWPPTPIESCLSVLQFVFFFFLLLFLPVTRRKKKWRKEREKKNHYTTSINAHTISERMRWKKKAKKRTWSPK